MDSENKKTFGLPDTKPRGLCSTPARSKMQVVPPGRTFSASAWPHSSVVFRILSTLTIPSIHTSRTVGGGDIV